MSENTATMNLIRELKLLSEPYYWERASTALQQLLSELPGHDYPVAPGFEQDSKIYVTAINDHQRQAIHAADKEPVVVVTGPPGTGKSQLVLNLITDAYLNGQSVLFASRNNRAVDVVMSRLKNEIHFQGAVRTGNKENRKVAADDMKNSLNAISASGKAIQLDPIREVLCPGERAGPKRRKPVGGCAPAFRAGRFIS